VTCRLQGAALRSLLAVYYGAQFWLGKGRLLSAKTLLVVQSWTNKVNKFGRHHTLNFCDLNYVRKWKVTLQTLDWHTYEDICMSRLSITGHLRVFGPQNLSVCQNNVLKIWKYAQLTDLDVVILILKYEKILASHSHGKKCTKYAYQSSQVPMFDQNQSQISPKSLLYQKMIRGIFLIATYTFSLTGYPKIAHI